MDVPHPPGSVDALAMFSLPTPVSPSNRTGTLVFASSFALAPPAPGVAAAHHTRETLDVRSYCCARGEFPRAPCEDMPVGVTWNRQQVPIRSRIDDRLDQSARSHSGVVARGDANVPIPRSQPVVFLDHRLCPGKQRRLRARLP